MNQSQLLPPPLEQRAKTTYEQILEEGFEKGIEKGIEIGREEGIEIALLAFMRKNPDWSDEQLAAAFDVRPAVVQKVRRLLLTSG